MSGINKEIKTIFGVSKASDAFDQLFCPSVELDALLKNGYQSELKVLKRALYESKPSFAQNLVKRQMGDVPILSIITSLFKGDDYIDGFLENTCNQLGFENYELIILNCNSPGNEESKILSYCENFPNIIYKKLDKDPGLYGAWNLGIEMSKGRYLTNANLDDRKSCVYYLLMLDWMMSNDYDVGASLFWTCTNLPEHGFDEDALVWYKDFSAYPSFFDFFKSDKSWTQIQDQCILGPMPIWKKSVHSIYGNFEEFNYGPSADYAMWLKLMRNGCSFGLYKVPLVYYLKLANSYARRVDTSTFNNRMLKETFTDFLTNQKKEIMINKIDLGQVTKIELPDPYFASTGVSHQCHPDVIELPTSWKKGRYMMAFTPYPKGDNKCENPCFAVSDDLESWSIPTGVKNPIIKYPGYPDYNADPHLFKDHNDDLYILYRLRSWSKKKNFINCHKLNSSLSLDPSFELYSSDIDSKSSDSASPSIVYNKKLGVYHMFLCHVTSDKNDWSITRFDSESGSLSSGFKNPTVIKLPLPEGRYPWHAYFRLFNEKLFFIVQDSDGTPGKTGKLYFGELVDFATVARFSILDDKDDNYRSAFCVDDLDQFHFFIGKTTLNICTVQNKIKQEW